MKRFLFVSGFLLLFALSVHAGTCSVPDINIVLIGAGLVQYTNEDYGVLAGSQVSVQCEWSFDPAPSTSCSCTQGDSNCYGIWMTNTFNGNDFNTLNQIPQKNISDFDCSSTWCTTQGRPREDSKVTRTITAHNDVAHIIVCGFREGQNPDANQLSAKVKLHVYSGDLCIPPDSGDFAIDSSCYFHDNEVLVSGNYIIQAGTLHTLVDTNVRFTDTAAVPHLISVAGEFDFNGSGKIFPEITQNENGKLILGFIGIMLVASIAFVASKTKQEVYV